MRLVKPTLKYRTSFQKITKEYAKEGRKEGKDDDIVEYIKEAKRQARGLNLSKELVPASIYWLIDDGEIMGRVSIRHCLNKKLRIYGGHIGYIIRPSKRRQGYGTQILKMALLKAGKIGIKKALITCNNTNITSHKIIQRNGGKIKDKIMFEKALICRYHIQIN